MLVKPQDLMAKEWLSLKHAPSAREIVGYAEQHWTELTTEMSMAPDASRVSVLEGEIQETKQIFEALKELIALDEELAEKLRRRR